MSDVSFHITIPQMLYGELGLYASRVAYSLADQTVQALRKEYDYIIDRFYSEYKPRKYVRHKDRGEEAGMPKTIRVAIYPTNGGMFGGIEFSEEDMYDDYEESKEQVLSDFLAGYHGPGYQHISSSIVPLTHMYRYVGLVAANIQRFVPKAERYAKSFGYTTI